MVIGSEGVMRVGCECGDETVTELQSLVRRRKVATALLSIVREADKLEKLL